MLPAECSDASAPLPLRRLVFLFQRRRHIAVQVRQKRELLVVTAAATLALRNPIKKWPMLFYALAVIVDVLFVVGSFVALPRSLWSGLHARSGRAAQGRPARAERQRR